MQTYTDTQHEALQRIADFDHVFCVGNTGDVFPPTFPGHHAPEALDVPILDVMLDGWLLPLSGLTNQYGYKGPWLHDSEQIPGGVAERVLARPGYWVAIYGQHTPDGHDCPFGEQKHDDGDCFCETTIEGWTLAYKPFTS